MRESTPTTIHLKDYQVPDFLIDEVGLDFEIHDDFIQVTTELTARRNPESTNPGSTLVLDGQDMKLQSVFVDGLLLTASDYTQNETSLHLSAPSDAFSVRTVCHIFPDQNTALEGLYRSGQFLLTQCEAEGFRKIAYHQDRPDVMSLYRVTIHANKDRYPVLLSNGNMVHCGGEADGRHFVTWEDPHKKPAYLFALVAGDLELVEDSFTTKSGNEVALRIYAEKENIEKCDFAMASLINAMRWDEQRFSLEYDLDVFNIVATNDFNMGAMENKSLNIFNSIYVLANAETATDGDYLGIEGVIGHEYFHNWTGNRVTCRDWFQLSLKEGLTVFRDQEFTADMQSRAVARIEDVRGLRANQFAEDAGPMSHPIRPDSYMEINNFYTHTVYRKGAEVVRMYHTLLGEEGFQKGMKLYFQRHDGQAVTCDDFRAAMADANDVNFDQFAGWYSQAGTPRVVADGNYDADTQSYTLQLSQKTPDTVGQVDKPPLQIPVAVGFIGADGKELMDTQVVNLTQSKQSFRFEGISESPVPSLLRGFSAPVKLDFDYSDDQLAFLMANDSDTFNRWEAAQRLAAKVILEGDTASEATYLRAAADTLANTDLDYALLAETLTLPNESYLAELVEVVDPGKIHARRKALKHNLANHLRDHLRTTYERLAIQGDYQFDASAAGQRALRNLCLSYLTTLDSEDYQQMARDQYHGANNMTDRMAALFALVHGRIRGYQSALSDYYERWQNDALVVDKWFVTQATVPQADTLDAVIQLTNHAAYSIKNPNKVRSLVGSFSRANPVAFHRPDGKGYEFVADYVLQLNDLNPQIAARMVGVFNSWKRFEPGRSGLMFSQIERIMNTGKLSPDVYEIVSKALK